MPSQRTTPKWFAVKACWEGDSASAPTILQPLVTCSPKNRLDWMNCFVTNLVNHLRKEIIFKMLIKWWRGWIFLNLLFLLNWLKICTKIALLTFYMKHPTAILQLLPSLDIIGSRSAHNDMCLYFLLIWDLALGFEILAKLNGRFIQGGIPVLQTCYGDVLENMWKENLHSKKIPSVPAHCFRSMLLCLENVP